MDKNSLTGLFLIGVLIIGFSFWMSPSDQEIKELQRKQDSVATVRKADSLKVVGAKQDTIVVKDAPIDTTAPFAGSLKGENTFYTIENELLKVTISSKGGRVYSVEVKNQKTASGEPLILFNGEENAFGLNFFAQNKAVSTSNLYFQPVANQVAVADMSKPASITMRLAYDAYQHIDFEYSLPMGTHLLDMNLKTEGLQGVINNNQNYLNLLWKTRLPKLENDIKKEREYSTIYYKYEGDEVDYISPQKDEQLELTTAVKWVSFKQHFFSSVLIADQPFEDAKVGKNTVLGADYLTETQADFTIPYKHTANESFKMKFYFGPNHFNTLKKYDMDLERLVNLGWGPLKYINRFAVIPIFNTLESWGLGYGLIILLLTIILKVVLFPLTYSSYMSTAKMRILKPEMDEIKAKVGEEDPAKLQQEYMKLYKRAGVNPLGGCIPLLLQMPILFAFFFFFPASFELRQKAFLWASDLSTYDTIWTFGNVPVVNFLYGDHVSLFCLLMTVSTLIYTRLNNQISGATGQMKWMGYLMPIVFLGVLNSYCAGLTYYYFLANMITFVQQWLIRRTVDDNELHRRIQENKKKPEKKSGWQQKLEDMTKARQQQAAVAKKKK